MGASISWLAVKTNELDQLFEMATVVPTTESDEWLESAISGGELRDGWYLLHAQGCEHPVISKVSLSRISTLGETIACSVEEHVMVSVAEGWNDGERSWKITHNAQENVFDLSTEGELPALFEATRDKLVSQQNAEGGEAADVDYIFDIPLQVARNLCGYKHDDDSPPWMPPGPVVFTQQALSGTKSVRSWWKFW